MLIKMDMELQALESPTSPPISPLNAGLEEDIGARVISTMACRVSRAKGRQ